MELDKAIKIIIDKFGKEIITEKRFVNMIADYYSFRDHPAEKRILSIIVDDGYSSLFLNNKTTNTITMLINSVVDEISYNYGIKEDLVDKCLIILLRCIGLNVEKSVIIPPITEQPILEFAVEEHLMVEDKVFYLKPRNIFSMSYGINVYDARGYYDFENGSFLILKGSYLTSAKPDYSYTNRHLLRKREEAIENNCHIENNYYFVDKDIQCSSPNEAAFVVAGMNMIGLIVWEDREGKSIYQDNRFEAVKRNSLSQKIF